MDVCSFYSVLSSFVIFEEDRDFFLFCNIYTFLSSFTMFNIDDDHMKEFIRLRALVRGLMHM